MLETVFGAYLAQKEGDLYYWSAGKYEVDFVHSLFGEITAYEIKSGRERDGQGLSRFLDRYPKAKVKLIDTREVEEMLGS